MSFPVIIVLAIFIGQILEESKDVRRYAVLDYSEGQWLSKAVKQNAAQSDLRRMQKELEATFAAAESEEVSGPEDFAVFQDKAKDALSKLAKNNVQKEFFDRIVGLFRPEDLGKPEGELMSSIQQRAFGSLMPWLFSLNEKEAEQLGAFFSANLDLEKYQEIENPELGEEAEDQLNQDLNQGKIFAYFVIGKDPVATDEDSRYVSNNVTDNDLRSWFSRHATEAVRKERITALNLSGEQARSILDTFTFDEKSVTETGETEDVGDQAKISQFAPIGFVYLLWIAVFTAAQMLLTNTVEEKSNRLIEVLLSSVSPMQLMAGKVIGIAATGLTIVLSWVVSALIGVQFIPTQGELNLSAIIGDPLYLTSFVGYFLAGYLLYAAVLVAMGSVCNSLKEAQNLMQPVIILLIVPLIAMMFIVQDPNGTLARILTYIPLYTPFLMMNRASGPPPAWEYVLSTLVIILSLIIAFWAAAKVFRVGILMTGKPPKLREIWRWLRAPVGTVHQRADAGASPDTQG
jgi:ABC-2 type transport system permease protein